ncbi:mitogen-activated protein kinase [Camillea tinctor]|nr:mitogen-activated protein kinase [Camillea tinctor]
MVIPERQARNQPVAIAPAPVGGATDLGAKGGPPQHVMPYACQTCAKRKVKCDKAIPICSSCRKSKIECTYQAPPPRWRTRKLASDVLERLARYERILHQHGLLEKSQFGEATISEPVSINWNEPEALRTGRLLAGQGRSRYIDSSLWHTIGDDGMQHVSDAEEEEEEEDLVFAGIDEDFALDPLTGAFIGSRRDLLQYHPTHEKAMILWETHIENVEPLCKILHIPSTTKMLEANSWQPGMASKVDECLMFAIYHFAVFSMTEEECAAKLGQPRAVLMQRYHLATRQALVNASFLRTTELSILQALVLFLMPCRYAYDSHTFWILTGVAVRIGQRMGIHKDGEKLGLPPFDDQMRRRLFYQLLPLDGDASQMTGTGISIMPDVWNTQRPLNINDDQIWPGMTEAPEEQKGGTEMVFCLSRSCLGEFFAGARRRANGANSGLLKDYQDAELLISEAENEVEEKYIRYCDIVNPLHFLTIGLARSGITAMRLRVRLPRVRGPNATDAEQREAFELAQKILDTDTTAYAHAGLKKYRWYVRPFFLWGTWDALIFVLTTLWKRCNLLLARKRICPGGRWSISTTTTGKCWSRRGRCMWRLGASL